MNLFLLALAEAVDACYTRDGKRAFSSITYLHESLDYQHTPEQSTEMAKLYTYCEYLINQGRYQHAASILENLRSVWNRILQFSSRIGRIDSLNLGANNSVVIKN